MVLIAYQRLQSLSLRDCRLYHILLTCHSEWHPLDLENFFTSFPMFQIRKLFSCLWLSFLIFSIALSVQHCLKLSLVLKFFLLPLICPIFLAIDSTRLAFQWIVNIFSQPILSLLSFCMLNKPIMVIYCSPWLFLHVLFPVALGSFFP